MLRYECAECGAVIEVMTNAETGRASSADELISEALLARLTNEHKAKHTHNETEQT